MGEQSRSVIEALRQGICDLKCDSRKVKAGDVFVALAGTQENGSLYAGEACKLGARWIICSFADQEAVSLAAPGCTILPVENPAHELGALAKIRWANDQAEQFRITGITGTNGKTTCAWLLEYILNATGKKTGLLGTVEYHWPGHKQAASLTTPDALALNEMFAHMRQNGVQETIMEVSSHSLAQDRIAGIDFGGAIFTNLTQDHLDYHKDMESYFQAKKRLFLYLPKKDKPVSINADDPYGRRLLEVARNAIGYGLNSSGSGDLGGEIISMSPRGMELKMSYKGDTWKIKTHLVGAFNASNILAVQALGIGYGLGPDQFKCLEAFTGVPGRLERVLNPQGLNIFVDYAHTPDALVNALQALRGAGFKRIVTLFGCGGNRDRSKRPLMGKAVARYSDIAFLTSDNPRREDPHAIMDDVRPGLADARQAFFEADRKEATRQALKLIDGDDALLIAGKGHEDYQIIGTRKHHYSDQEVVRELLGCD